MADFWQANLTANLGSGVSWGFGFD